VISTFAGLRPLVRSGHKNSTKELSRKEEIFETESGLITITGGKLTTWRRMAERVVDLISQRFERNGRRSVLYASVTNRIRLAGGSIDSDPARAAAQYDVSAPTVEHLMNTYGGNYRVVLDITRESKEMKETLVRGLPHIEA